jgi:hypothetical protein
MTSMTTIVNERVSIAQACRWAGLDAQEGQGNRKTWCPFGITHPDSGMEAAFRLYEDTNSCYCFACARSWTPVSLMADFWDCGRPEAADKICKMAGIRPPGWQDRWDELHQPVVPDRNALAEALKTWCRRMRGPSWEAEQLQPRFAVPLGDCLALLPLVFTRNDSEEWLDGCKLVLNPLLKE